MAKSPFRVGERVPQELCHHGALSTEAPSLFLGTQRRQEFQKPISMAASAASAPCT